MTATNTKTAWDAVNELKGDLSNSYKFNINSDSHLHYADQVDEGIEWCCFSGENVSKGDQLVCTVDLFNDLVSQLETNFGTSVTFKEWLINKENELKYISKVGEKCLVNHQSWGAGVCMEVTPIAITGDFTVSINSENEEQVFMNKMVTFKPLPSEEEKAIDDLIDVLSDSYTDITDIIKGSGYFKHYAKALIKAGYHNQPRVKHISIETYRSLVCDLNTTVDSAYNWMIENNCISQKYG